MKIKIDHFEANGLYLVWSSASANTLYFEDKIDHQMFLSFVDNFLGKMIDVVHYSIVPTGWALIFRTKSDTEIKEAYFTQRSKSKKVIFGQCKEKIGLMLSEHFRFAISLYVKSSNVIHNRHGSKIHSRIQKFILPTQKVLENEIKKMEALVEFCEQTMPWYRPDYNFYCDDEMLSMDHKLKSAKRLYKSKNSGLVTLSPLVCFVDLLVKMDVVRKLIANTCTLHSWPINPKNPPP